MAAVLDNGAHSVEDIKKQTGLGKADIEGIISTQIQDGSWEWVSEIKLGVTAGIGRKIIHVVGEPVFA